MSCCDCGTRVIQINTGGGAGGGPFTVTQDAPAPGQVTITDTTSGNTFVINVSSLVDFTTLTPAQLTALCTAITDNCGIATNINLNGNILELIDGQGNVISTVNLTALLGNNIYNIDGALTGNRVVTQGGNDLTFLTGGGDFIIDGKLTVTGLLDPTGLQFTGGVQADAGMPNGTIYVTDGSASGFPSGEIIFKDFTGVYHRLENQAGGGDNYATADLVATGARVHQWGANPQSEIFTTGVNTRSYTVLPIDTTVTEGAVGFTAASQNSINLHTAEIGTDAGTSSARLQTNNNPLGVSAYRSTFAGLQMVFHPQADLSINGNVGTAGQVITSQGANLPPVWAAASAGGGTIEARSTRDQGGTFDSPISPNPYDVNITNTLSVANGTQYPTFPGGGIVVGTGAGITFPAGPTPILATLTGSPTAAYEIWADFVVAHTASVNVFALLADFLTPNIYGLAAIHILGTTLRETIRVQGIVKPTVDTDYRILFGKSGAGIFRVFALSYTVKRLSA